MSGSIPVKHKMCELLWKSRRLLKAAPPVFLGFVPVLWLPLLQPCSHGDTSIYGVWEMA